MELIKRKILLENSVDRTNDSPTWGVMTATSFFVKVSIMQNTDDMGLFTDLDYISFVGFPSIMTVLTETDNVTLRLPIQTESSFYSYGNLHITGFTDSKIEDVRSYDEDNRYKVGFDMESETYIDYSGGTVSGVSRVYSAGEPTTYVFDTKDDANMGTSSQKTGLLYKDYSGETRNVLLDGVRSTVPVTSFDYLGEGINETNVSLSALTKEEYLFGIVSPPEVEHDVFIDRGITAIMERHLILSEVKNLGQLSRYGNGYYKITRQ